MTSTTGPPAAFRHEAFFYDSPVQFFDGVLRFIEDGVVAAEPMLVVLERPKIDEVRRRVSDASRIEFADMAQVGGNPGRIIPLWSDFLERHAGVATSLRGVGEPIDAARQGEELAECQVHEALLNVAFAESVPWRLLCPYDVGQLPVAVIDEAHRSHPFVEAAGSESRPSSQFDPLATPTDVLVRPMPAPPADALDVPFAAETLPHARRLVGAESVRCGLAPARAADLELAVAEAAANSLFHGGGAGRLRLWCDGQAVVAEVSDGGSLGNPLAGRIRPPVDQVGGRGLWIVQQVCDLVQLRSTAGRTTVRMHMKLDR